MPEAWVLQQASHPRARARLLCFAHAGGGASAFRLWAPGLPPGLGVAAVRLPGREGRLREAPLASIPALVEALVPALRPHLDLPFAFFGHSMGAVLAIEVARALEAAGGPSATHLFVSGRRPPHLAGPETPLHVLPDAAFVVELERRYGGIPAAIRENAELLELLLPALRADIRALETHRPLPGPPVACPISAFGGADDPLTPRAHLEAWAGETRAAFRVRVFPGGHFYLERSRGALLADVAATLAPVLAPPLRPGEVAP